MSKQYNSLDNRPGVAINYAKIIGAVVLVVGILGLLFGNPRILGFNSDIVEDIVHLSTGAIMAYVGFAQRDNRLARTVVGALGVVYLVVGILGFVDPSLFGLIPNLYNLADNLLHLGLGVLGIIIGYFLPAATAVD
ncbi:MAG: hypothetical protein AVDCRST_MAG93-5971 [uncultured Chloroflexia bacterium]|uniref:DUF4383 domain-containing protein n=1 Tax=uncultured Chloroflexia bacterium TaxID=1672391 RepID=A0A6J4LDQ9_9CHLR|nr:MAG: hypothetical protein AVDCRST_MAG93-5971 [uncultured Chloroflexia bacterium]